VVHRHAVEINAADVHAPGSRKVEALARHQHQKLEQQNPTTEAQLQIQAPGTRRVETLARHGTRTKVPCDHEVAKRGARARVHVLVVLVRGSEQDSPTIPEQTSQVSGRPLHLADCGNRAIETGLHQTGTPGSGNS
jgi:hypothetical protein